MEREGFTCNLMEYYEPKDCHDSDPCASLAHHHMPFGEGFLVDLRVLYLSVEDCDTVDYIFAWFNLSN